MLIKLLAGKYRKQLLLAGAAVLVHMAIRQSKQDKQDEKPPIGFAIKANVSGQAGKGA